MIVSIRPLQEGDAKKSFQWRNDPRIWRLTGSRPSKYITVEMERDWLRQAVSRSDEIRFAICVSELEEYVGNAQLTRITEVDAEYHIFIGEISFQGKGIGSQATQLVLDYAQKVLGLKTIYLVVRPENFPAIKIYVKCGFELVSSSDVILTYRKVFNK